MLLKLAIRQKDPKPEYVKLITVIHQQGTCGKDPCTSAVSPFIFLFRHFTDRENGGKVVRLRDTWNPDKQNIDEIWIIRSREAWSVGFGVLQNVDTSGVGNVKEVMTWSSQVPKSQHPLNRPLEGMHGERSTPCWLATWRSQQAKFQEPAIPEIKN